MSEHCLKLRGKKQSKGKEHRDRDSQQCCGAQGLGVGRGVSRREYGGAKWTAMDGDLTWVGKHTIQCTGNMF